MLPAGHVDAAGHGAILLDIAEFIVRGLTVTNGGSAPLQRRALEITADGLERQHAARAGTSAPHLLGEHAEPAGDPSMAGYDSE